MPPLVLPASTVTTLGAGALITIVVWCLKAFAGIEVPEYVSGAMTTLASVLACHFTDDHPTKPAVEAAVKDAEKKEDAVTAAVAKDAA